MLLLVCFLLFEWRTFIILAKFNKYSTAKFNEVYVLRAYTSNPLGFFLFVVLLCYSIYSIFSIHKAEAVLFTRFPLTQFDSVDFTVKPDECGHSSGDKSQQIKSSANPILWANVYCECKESQPFVTKTYDQLNAFGILAEYAMQRQESNTQTQQIGRSSGL